MAGEEAGSLAARNDRQWEPLERAHWLIAAAVLLLVSIPVLIVKYPPAADYLLHIGRMDILSRSGDSFISRIYEPRWSILPNLAIDVIVPPLSALVGLSWAGKIFMLAIVWLHVTGGAAMMYALKGRATPFMLLPAALVFNYILAWGFLNYLFGIGLGFWGFALWILLRSKPLALRLAVFLVIALLIFFCHMVALGVFVMLITTYELGLFVFRELRPQARLGNLLLAAGQAVVPLLLYFFFSPLKESTRWQLGTLEYKIRYLVTFFSSLDWPAERLSTVALFGLFFLPLGLRWVSIDRRFVAPAAALLAVYFAIPNVLHNAGYLDTRLTLPFYFVLAAGLVLTPRGKRFAGLLLRAVGVLLVARTGLQAADWRRDDLRYQQTEALFDRLPSGSILFSAAHPALDIEPLWGWWHQPNLAGVGRDVYVPQVWLDRGQQPLWVHSWVEPIKVFQENDPPDRPLDSPEFHLGMQDSLRIYRQNMADMGLGSAPAFLIYFWGHEERKAPPPYLREVGRGFQLSLYELVD